MAVQEPNPTQSMRFQNPIKQKPYRRILFGNLVFPMALVVISGFVFTLLVFRLLSSSQWVAHTDQVIAQSNLQLRLIIDAETGLRGYLITGKKPFLEPYVNTTQTFDTEMAELKSLVSDNPEQKARLEEIYTHYRKWLDYSHTVMEMKKKDRDYKGYVTLGYGKELVDDMREQFNLFITTEEDLRNHRQQTIVQVTRSTILTVILASLVTVFAIILFGSRQLIILSENYNRLLSTIEREKGDLLTAQKSAENATYQSEKLRTILAESEKQFRTLAESLPQLAWMANPDGWIFWFNQRWYEYTGATLTDMEGWGWKRVHHPDHVHRVEEKYRIQFTKGEDWEDTFPLHGKNGEWKWFLSRARPIKDDHGNITRWIGTNTDVTEQKRVEDERARLQVVETEVRRKIDIYSRRLANLQAVTEASLSRNKGVDDLLDEVLAYVEMALEGDTVEIFLLTENSQFFEVRASRVVGEPLANRMQIPIGQGVCGKIFSSGQAIKINNLTEMDVASPTLRRTLKSLVGCPLRTKAGPIGVIHAGRTKNCTPFDDDDLIFLQLIADRLATAIDNANLYKRVEANVISLQQEQIVREKFVTTLSHDLRTPLTAAKMSAQLIGRKVTDVEAVQSLAVRVVDNVNRADHMIQDLLDANRIQAGHSIQPNIQAIDLVEVVKRSLDDLITIHGDRFILKAPNELSAELCGTGMRRIVENLCTNAIKYGRTKSPIRVVIEDHGTFVSLCVHNFGEPLTLDERARLFHQFERLSADKTSGKEGWGIGLTIVKGIAEAHGGKVEVESVKNGTIFRVILLKDARPFQSKQQENKAAG